MTLERPMFPPVDPTRRRFLSQAAGVATGGAVLALATIPPALALAEHTRLDRLGDPDACLISEAPCDAQMDAFNDLIETAPTTFAGLVAWASYLDEIGRAEPEMFIGEGQMLVAVLTEALGNLAVPS